MNAVTIALGLAVALAFDSAAQTTFTTLTREHTDMRILYRPDATNVLDLVMRDEDRGINHATNDVILIAREQARLTLPAGTPFGDGGQPFWILPQTQNVNLLYLGVSAEGIAPGIFNGPLTIALKRFAGPGYFMAWQATGPGQFNIRVNTRDGLSASDAFTPITGSHEHFNWGFSSTGVFSATFQVSARRNGESTNLLSPECTFVFHVLPLAPPTNFLAWQRSYWPPGFNPAIAGASADPDGDAFSNWHEYAFGISPTNANPITPAPSFEWSDENVGRVTSASYTRYLPGLDLDYAVESTADLTSDWTPLENITSVAPDPGGLTERVTVRDTAPSLSPQRFLRLTVKPR